MFDTLTFGENTELYMILARSVRTLGRASGMLISLDAYDAAGTVNAMTDETVRLLEDLNAAARDVRTFASAAGL